MLNPSIGAAEQVAAGPAPSRPTAADETPSPTIGWLAHVLTEQVVAVASAPRGLEVPVRGVWIYEEASSTTAHAGDVALCVGAELTRTDAVDTFRRLHALGVVGAVVKAEGGLTASAFEGARETGIAVLRASPGIEWGQLYSLARVAISSGRSGGPMAMSEVHIGDLFSLANATASLVGGAVTIEDAESRVLAYSNLGDPIDERRRDAILGRRVPEDRIRLHRERGVFRELWRNPRPIKVPGNPHEHCRARYIAAVTTGDTMLGSIWVVEGDQPLSEQQIEALSEAARVAALHMVRARFAPDLERQRRSEAFRAALDGRCPYGATLSSLGFGPGVAITLCALRPTSPSSEGSTLLTARLADLLHLAMGSGREAWAVAELRGITYAAISSHRDDGGERTLRDLLARGAATLGGPLRCAIGSVVHDPDLLPSVRWQVDALLPMLHDRPGAPSVASTREYRGAIFAGLAAELLSADERFVTGVLEEVRRYDECHGTDYLRTIDEHIHYQGAAGSCSLALGVHVNTLRYRLQRLHELFGIDPADPDFRFSAECELRARRHLAADGRGPTEEGGS